MRPRGVLLLAVLVLIVGCGGRAGIDEPLASPPEVTPSASDAATPCLRCQPRQSPDVPAATDEPAPDVSQTDTEWGRIWDALPGSFPVYPGAVTSAEAGAGEPVSALFSVPGAAADEIATWMQSELELATYSTEALSGPLEDGSFVLDSVGDDGCRIQTTVAPAGGLTLITVRYGADCPIE